MLYFAVFGCFLILGLWLMYEIKKNDRMINRDTSDFWQEESLANQTRKVPVDTLPYIQVPLENFPIGLYSDQQLQESEQILLELKDKKILNLTGKTATDIKAEYGAANLPFLDQCDMNYTDLVKTIASYGVRLHELGHDDDAITVLESGIDILTDIRMNYKVLATLYQERNQPEKISHLKEVAEGLNSLNKNTILKDLEEKEK